MPDSRGRKFVVLMYVVLILITLAVFRQVHSFEFLYYDDHSYVHENARVAAGLTWDGVVWAFTSGYASNWHPLTWLSHMLDCQLFGLNAGAMHLVNVLYHMANTLLLFTLLRRITGSLWQGFFVTAAFAVHPTHVESVAWISERKDVLSTFFLLLTLLAYVRYFRSRKVSSYIAAIVLYAAGLMSKPMLVTLPMLLLLLDYWPLNRIAAGFTGLPRLIVEKIPFFILAAISSLVTYLVQHAGGAMADSDLLPLQIRLANAFISYVKYLGKALWPRNLAVFYPLEVNRFTFWEVTGAVILLLVITMLVVWIGRNRRYLAVGWFWYLGTLVPVIGLVQVGMQSMADRYTYIPYIGLFIMFAWGVSDILAKLTYRKVIAGMTMAVVLFALGMAAHRQVGWWKNGVTLFSRAIEVTGANYVACGNRATAYAKLGKWDEAIADYLRASSFLPDNAKTHHDLGFVYGRLGRWQEALVACRRAIMLKPDYTEAYINCGAAYGKLGLRQEAVDSFQKALELAPSNPEAHKNMAIELSALARYEEAAEHYRLALKSKPDWSDVLNNLAWLLAAYPDLQCHNPDEAVKLVVRAAELTGHSNAVCLDTLGGAYAAAGRFKEAIETAKKALELAEAAGQTQIAEGIRERLALYSQGKPYIEQTHKTE